MQYKTGEPYYDSNTPYPYKYTVITPSNKKIHFGDRRYKHFKDKTKQKKWKNLNHYDKNRRKMYLKRAKGIIDKNKNLTWNNKESSNYYSIKYLW